MHPPISVVIFTVLSGFGLGLFSVLVLIGTVHDGIHILLTSLALILIGMSASVFHLANPKNGWRAITCFRTSWLSREIVFLLLFLPVLLFLIVSNYFQLNLIATSILAYIGLALAFLIIYSTGMIYACLKTVPEWHSLLTPVNYILISLASGSVLYSSLFETKNMLTVSVLVIALIAKIKYYFHCGKPTKITINNALGLENKKINLLDSGHSSPNFIDKEFGYKMSSLNIIYLRVLVAILSFIIPLILLILNCYQSCVFVMLFGLLLERWLFFADTNHVVNLYRKS